MLVVFLAVGSVGLSLNLAQAIPPMEMSKVAQLFSSWPLQGVTLQQIRLLEAASAGPARDGHVFPVVFFEAKMKSSLSTSLGCGMHEDTSLCP